MKYQDKAGYHPCQQSYPTDFMQAVHTFTRSPSAFGRSHPQPPRNAPSTMPSHGSPSQQSQSIQQDSSLPFHGNTSSNQDDVVPPPQKEPSPSYSECYKGTLSQMSDLSHYDNTHAQGSNDEGLAIDSERNYEAVANNDDLVSLKDTQESVTRTSTEAPLPEIHLNARTARSSLLTVGASQVQHILNRQESTSTEDVAGTQDASTGNIMTQTSAVETQTQQTQSSNQTARKYMSPSSLVWFEAIQQERNLKKSTLRQQCPKVWDLVGSYIKCWREEEWEGPDGIVNPSDFKKKVVKHILESRVKIPRSEIPCRELLPKETGPLVYFYSQMTFEEHAERNYKKDIAKIAKSLEVKPNDVVRFFGVAFMGTNRDDLTSLGIGKATNRQQLDGDLSMVDSIMRRWHKDFHNYGVVLMEPSRAAFLESYCDLDPNDHTRIEIKREWKFFKKLFFSYLAKYNVSMKKWTKGTGGGPGADENYANWMDRNDEIFVNYCGAKDADVLAWIYMLDKKEGFPLNVRNNPPPADTVMEDGTSNASRSTQKKKAAKTRSMQAMENFTINMEKTFSTLTDMAKLDKGNSSAKVNGRLQAFELIDLCETKLKELREEESNSTQPDNLRSMKIKSLEKCLVETFESLPK